MTTSTPAIFSRCFPHPLLARGAAAQPCNKIRWRVYIFVSTAPQAKRWWTGCRVDAEGSPQQQRHPVQIGRSYDGRLVPRQDSFVATQPPLVDLTKVGAESQMDVDDLERLVALRTSHPSSLAHMCRLGHSYCTTTRTVRPASRALWRYLTTIPSAWHSGHSYGFTAASLVVSLSPEHTHHIRHLFVRDVLSPFQLVFHNTQAAEYAVILL